MIAGRARRSVLVRRVTQVVLIVGLAAVALDAKMDDPRPAPEGPTMFVQQPGQGPIQVTPASYPQCVVG